MAFLFDYYYSMWFSDFRIYGPHGDEGSPLFYPYIGGFILVGKCYLPSVEDRHMLDS